MQKVAILGAGIAGIAAGYHLKQKGIESVIYEQDDTWGGLCGNFEIKGFRFDKAPHFSFTKNEYVKALFKASTPFFTHETKVENYYKNKWLAHPAQNNLAPLEDDEKVQILQSFIDNPYRKKRVKNYEEWLKAQYGSVFSENFPMRYARKIWCKEPKDLDTSWIGARMASIDLQTLLKGAFKEQGSEFYIDELRYPKDKGYKNFFSKMAQKCDMKFNKKVREIDLKTKNLHFEDGSKARFDVLLSSIALPKMARLVTGLEKRAQTRLEKACAKLEYTSLALVSLGFKRANIAKFPYFYMYDENILPCRCHSPSIKSPSNVPEGCSSLQFEIYFSKEKPLKLSGEKMIEHIIKKGEEMRIFKREDVILKDFRVLEFANVIFYHGMQKDRQIALDALRGGGIECIGRFGEWDYLWSDQSLMSGVSAAGRVTQSLQEDNQKAQE